MVLGEKNATKTERDVSHGHWMKVCHTTIENHLTKMPRIVDGIEVVFMPRILDSIGEMLKLAGYFRELYCLRLEKWTELREEKSPEKWMELGRI